MKKIKLGDIGTVFNGATIPTSEGIYPAYGGNGIIKNVSDYNFEGNVIAIGRVGAQCGIVHFCKEKCWITDNCLCFQPKENFNPYYVYYILKLLNLNKFHIGSAQPLITQSIIENLDYDFVMNRSEQDKVAALLGALDDKITLNKKINATLEAMAKTLYMHEFFRKSPNGKLADIVVENSKSTIQVGAAKSSDGAFPFFTSGDSILSWSKSLVDGRNIFLNTGGNAGIKFYVGKAAYSTDTWCITAEEDLTDYLYMLLKVIEPELDKKFFQGTGLKHLQKPLLKGRAIYIPTETEREKFNSIVQPAFTKISANIRESRRLTELRDWLLPMLMNRQLGFKTQ